MRRLMSGLLSAGLLLSTTAVRAEDCVQPADQSVFDVEGLKSMMLVLATNCQEDSQYNEFVNRYKPELGKMERDFDGYFRRTYGRRGQAEHDEYITQLANAQFIDGLQQGSDFCRHNSMVFAEAMALRNGADLPAFAAGKGVMPKELGSCASASTPAKGGPRRATKKHA